jgi:hypothetical protein
VTLTADVIAAGERLVEAHEKRKADFEAAFREWKRLPTLSNALRRDDARKAYEGMSDAYTVALAVVGAADRLDRMEAVVSAARRASQANTGYGGKEGMTRRANSMSALWAALRELDEPERDRAVKVIGEAMDRDPRF